MKLIFDLPFFNPTVGGVVETLKLASNMGASVRFQRKSEYKFSLPIPYTYGLPDKSFPLCDVVITYSDNPYLEQLLALPQVGKVIIYMLSYGMSLERERANVSNPNVKVICSTVKIENAIKSDGFDVTRVGFALDMDGFYDYNSPRKQSLAIYYHPMESKRYSKAVDISDGLYAQGLIDHTISFGCKDHYSKAPKPMGLYYHVQNATKTSVRNIFNESKAFVMPSISEGLNLTPIEATLCGCPSVICDGAIGEIFFDGQTCLVARNDNELIEYATLLVVHSEDYAHIFRDNMKKIVKDYTMDNLISNINSVL